MIWGKYMLRSEFYRALAGRVWLMHTCCTCVWRVRSHGKLMCVLLRSALMISGREAWRNTHAQL